MKRIAKAHWNGTLQEGTGEISTQSNVLNETQYSFKTALPMVSALILKN